MTRRVCDPFGLEIWGVLIPLRRAPDPAATLKNNESIQKRYLTASSGRAGDVSDERDSRFPDPRSIGANISVRVNDRLLNTGRAYSARLVQSCRPDGF